jgi:hypothetical protein
MRRLALLPIVTALSFAGALAPRLAAAKPPAGPSTKQPTAGGAEWASLFNGKDLANWAVKCKPKDRERKFWRVEKGAILADSLEAKGHDYVWLYSAREYSDFILRLRFHVSRTSKGNSGVQIRSRYDDEAGWLDGPQVDIHPAGPWRTGMIWDETRGSKRWLFPNVPKGKWVNESMAPKGLVFHHTEDGAKWNEMEITALGTKLRASLNGLTVMDWDGRGVLDDETHRLRNVGMKGHVALQIHRGDRLRIRYKDIRILAGTKAVAAELKRRNPAPK